MVHFVATRICSHAHSRSGVVAHASSSGGTSSGRSGTTSGKGTTSGRAGTTSGKQGGSVSNKTAAAIAYDPLSEWYGPNRRTYIPEMDPPSWLNGTMAGDHGCDFLGICSDERTIDQFRRGEVINGRFAMLGTVGMLVPEILSSSGVEGIKGARWWETGSTMLHGGTINYFGAPVPINLQGVIVINAALVFLAEWFRFQEFAPGFEPETDDTLYPGGPFDPLGLAEDPEKFQLLKVNEVRNGRLAMMGFLGFVWQAYITRKGPWENLQEHISNPTAHNILTEWPKSAESMAL